MDFFFSAIFAMCAAMFAALTGLMLIEGEFGLSAACLCLCLFAYKSAFDAMKLAQQG